MTAARTRAGGSVAVALAVVVALAYLAGSRQGSMVAGPPRVSEDAPATAMDLALGAGNNSPALVVDPTDSRFVVMASRIDIPDFSCALEVSGDGGRGWIGIDPVSTLPEGVEKCYAPEAAFDRSGRLYYLFVGLAGNGNQPVGAFLSSSTDRGATFSLPHRILGPENFSVRMAIDRSLGRMGRIHIAWLHAGAPPGLGGFPSTTNPILSSYSDDGGETFSAPVQIDGTERRRVLAPALVLGPGHDVRIAYYDLEDDARDYQGLEGPVWEGTWSLVVASSTDAGKTFGPGESAVTGIVPPERIMLVFTMPPASIVTWKGHVCVAWTDARAGDPDVYTRCSSRGRWGDLVRVNQDEAGNGHRQYLPRLAVSPNHRLDVVYLDRPDPFNRYNDTAYAYSTDDGVSFHKPVTISTHTSDTRIGAQYGVISAAGQVEFGSRLGLLSLRDRAVAAWPDTRNSTRISTSQDIFVANVEVPVRPEWQASRVLALVGCGVVLLVTGALSIRRRRARRTERRRRDAGSADLESSLPDPQGART